jgi:arabinofuranosyltransferase
MRQHARHVPAGLAFTLLALVVWRGVLPEFRLDDSFITYRCARNLAQGAGLVYNPGERVLVTTAPLFAIVLAFGSALLPDLDLLGRLLGAIAVGLGGWLIASAAGPAIPRWLQTWAGVAYVLASPLWLALGMETPLWLAATLGGWRLGRSSRWGTAGFVMALAVLLRPDALLPALLLALLALRTRPDLPGPPPTTRYATGLLPLLGLAGLILAFRYGSLVPATLAAKQAQASLGITGLGVGVGWWAGLALVATSLFRQSFLYLVFALLALGGLVSRERRCFAFFGFWAALHLVIYASLGVAPYRWYYLPLLPALVLYAALGVDLLRRRLPPRAWPALALVAAAPLAAEGLSLGRIAATIRNGGPGGAALPIVDWDVYRRTGGWLDAHAPADARVGVAETGQLGFYARRPMTDYLGLLQPDVAGLLRRRDLYSWLVDAAPEYLVLQRFGGRPLVLYNHVIEKDPWFRASYTDVISFDDPRYPAGPVSVLRRERPRSRLQPQTADHAFGELHLVGLATDGGALDTAGGPLRVRLDWEVGSALPQTLHVAIKLHGLPAGFDGDYATGLWRGRASSFHGLLVPDGVRAGAYPILVAVGPRGGPYETTRAGELRIGRIAGVTDTPAAGPTSRRRSRTRP